MKRNIEEKGLEKSIRKLARQAGVFPRKGFNDYMGEFLEKTRDKGIWKGEKDAVAFAALTYRLSKLSVASFIGAISVGKDEWSELVDREIEGVTHNLTETFARAEYELSFSQSVIYALRHPIMEFSGLNSDIVPERKPAYRESREIHMGWLPTRLREMYDISKWLEQRAKNRE